MRTSPVSAYPPAGGVERAAAPGLLRRWLAFEGHPPGRATIWVVGYLALFLVRPWEVMVPWLEPLRLESLGVAILVLRVLLGGDTSVRLEGRAATLLVFVASIFVVAATSFERGISMPWATLTLKLALFGLCVIATMRTPADLRAFCLAWVAIMAVYETKAIYEYVVHDRGVHRMGFFRLIGIEDSYGHSNTFAGKAVALLPFIGLLYATATRRLERRFLGVAFVLSGAVVVLTGSRSAMLAAVFAGLLYILVARRRALALGVAAGGLLVSLVLLPDAIWDRYRTLLDPQANASAEASLQGRWIGFRKGLQLFGERPLVGIGPGVFPTSHEYVGRIDEEVEDLQSHNLVAQVLGETGLVGAFGFGALLTTLFAGAWRLHRGTGRGGSASGFLSRLGTACAVSGLLMLFLGVGSHNLFHYNWIWLASLVIAGQAVSQSPIGGLARPRNA